jgi:uncharacterized phage protein (TIGR02218 family)
VCWKIKRTDGTLFAFTSTDKSFAFDLGDGDGSLTYSASTGVAPSTLKSGTGTGVDNLSVLGIINSDLIIDSDITGGKFDNAKLTLFFVNFMDLTMGKCILMKGYFGEVKVTSISFEVEIRSLSQRYMQQVGRVCNATCDAQFGDARCNVNGGDMSPYTINGTVTAVDGTEPRRKFTSTDLSGKANHYYRMGKITWNTGLNTGFKQDSKDNVAGAIELMLSMPFTITIGDTFTIIAGCDKLLTTCDTFSNVVNFRGFPYIPGSDAVLRIIKA